MKLFSSYMNPVFFLLLVLIVTDTTAQVLPFPNYPKGYFRWPLDIQPALVANFGELRPNHYHMGLDCRTDQKQNLRVAAAADGYIAKVKIEPFGFGRCIYINHPNGLTTLYAHLNDFNPELEKYITAEQYKQKSWRVFLDIPAGMFPVTKGQFIAYSGSTGGSEGPHVHFEIRDTKTEKVLNPLLFGLPITDDIAPDVLRLAVYDRSISVYEQSPKMYPVKKVNGVYVPVPATLICNTDKVSFAITSFDRYTGSTSRNGIFQAILCDNEMPVVGFQIDSISYDETRYLNAHIDYRMRSTGGPFVQHLSRLPGYPNGIYKIINGDGVIRIDDDSVHKIKIEVKDAYGNTSSLRFDVKRGPDASKNMKANTASTLDQRKFYPGVVNIFENSNISFYLPANSLYDSIHFRYNEKNPGTVNAVYQLHSPDVPVHGYFPVKIKTSIPIALRDKVVMERFWNAKTDFAKAVPLTSWNEIGWYKASFREFGYFQLLIDTIPPNIVPVGFKDGMNMAKQNRLAFVVGDNTEEVKNFTATLDGNWLRFTNDKGRTFIYIFDERCAPGEHELKISAEDCVGNRAEKSYHFTR